MIKSKKVYADIIKDLSGSISQNRFKFQRYWAIKKIYELYKCPSDFVVVFDFACDVDVFIDNQLHFYEVKTSSAKKYSVNNLIRVGKKSKNPHSIISKLSLLENYDNVVSLNIVSNIDFKEKQEDGKKVEILCLDDLQDSIKEKISKHVYDRNGQEIDLKKIFYINSSLCTDSSYEQLLGETVKFLELEFTTSDTRASMFLDWLIRESEIKSTYEYDVNNIEAALNHKGITRIDFKTLLDKYSITDNSSIKEVDEIIKSEPIYSDQVRLQKALAELRAGGIKSLRISDEIEKIINELESDVDLLRDTPANIRKIAFKSIIIDDSFTKSQKEILIILAMVKLKRGKL